MDYRPEVWRAIRTAAAPSIRMFDTLHEAMTATTRASARRRITRELPADPSAGHHARRTIDQVCTRWGLTALQDPGRLIVTELVSNALQHGSAPIELHIIIRPRALHIEVSDHSPALPLRAPRDLHHGLRLIEALTSSWGARPTAAGKTVWTDLILPPRATTAPNSPPAAAPSASAAQGDRADDCRYSERGRRIAGNTRGTG